MRAHARVAGLLLELEATLHDLGLWAEDVSHPQALASVQPFCIDTLAFEQWLQFVFLPRMHTLLDAGAALPPSCAIAEMGEICFAGDAHAGLVVLLRAIDVAVTTSG